LKVDQLLRSLFFRPERGFFVTPDQFGLAYEDIVFRARDGAGLHGWFIPSHPPANESQERPVTVLLMHGVGGNISHRAENAAALKANLDLQIFLFDYRGYGRSSGEPSEEGTYLDAEAAFETLCARPEVDPDRIILYGHSLGGAVAIDLAVRLESQIHGLVVENSFTSGRAVARLMLPVMPENAVPEFYNSLLKIGQVRAPVLITHAELDGMLPPAMGRELHAAANEPKTFYLVPGADHSNIHLKGGKAYFQQWRSFISICDAHKQRP
jgi:fermentation-respiration switch protein FrsA (DUF1100 family)